MSTIIAQGSTGAIGQTLELDVTIEGVGGHRFSVQHYIQGDAP